ncbi:MAG TPA: efflux RND transporter periplasmic adaptor subunit [Steroidobacteraceae bacterium]|jgi:HlyD family secretion protein
MEQPTSPDGTESPRRRARLLWTALVLLIVVAAVAVWWWRSRNPPLHYVTARVTQGDIQRSVNMTGALNPVVTAQVESFVSGNIKSWSCDYNTLVTAGQICALIDPLPFQVIVDQDTASLHSAMAQLAKDRVAAANQAVIYAYDQKLIDQGIVSRETINADKATLDQDQSQVKLDEANIAQQRALLHGAEVNLGYTKIPSPVNGMVITRYIDVGQTVVSSLSASPLFLIGKDMHDMQVDTNVSEADVGGVRPKQRAYFTVQSYPNRTFWGSVRQIREGPITVQNVVTYDVVIDVKNEDLALFPGMTADAHIITAERSNVLRVPLPATRFNPEGIARSPRAGGSARTGDSGARSGDRGGRSGGPGARAQIWLLRDGKLVSVRVRTGLDDGTLIEVAGDDLKVGDVVVVNAIRPNAPPSEAQGDNRPPGANANIRGAGFRP